MGTIERALTALGVAAVLAASAFSASAQQVGYIPGNDAGSSVEPGSGSGAGSALDHRQSHGQSHGRTYGLGLAGRGYIGAFTVGAGGVTGAPVDLALSADDVKVFFERWVASQGDPRLAVGDVEEQNADTVIVKIVTKDDSGPIQRFAVDRHTGSYQPDEG
jgi:hypothetical protein